MKVHFLGVGAAFDENHTNISMILEANEKNILLDCGYDVPHELFKYNDDPDFLDAIWISHPHADHYYGLGMLIRLKGDGRTKPLTILTRPEIKHYIETIIDNSYPGSYEDCQFDINYLLFDDKMEWEGINFRIAPTIHPVPNKALRVEANGKVFCYSGDGMFTDESKELFRNSDLLVHETFTLEEEIEGHGNISAVAGVMGDLEVKTLAAVHIEGDERSSKDVQGYIDSLEQEVFLPVEGDTLDV